VIASQSTTSSPTLHQVILFHLTLALLQWTTVDNNNDDDDDDDPMLLLERTADNDNNGNLQVERVPCCPPFLQLIVDKDYMDDQMTTFLIVRRYELRILPIGRRGSLFPFQDQYIPQV
jgi:hypothetical protein